eukprot:TRINITY_DN1527_c0_g1_i1.p1 TRINITY_DN1527_c0_g1~~TRINITY_DN1527_c0_g1_i1.p1  ORF type:complete len:681 (-),score=83.19 TRINITY_DN1527_c0_g1_i1:14-2056(-)
MKTQSKVPVTKNTPKKSEQKPSFISHLFKSDLFFTRKTQVTLLVVAVFISYMHFSMCGQLFEGLRWWSTRNWIQKHSSFYSEQAMYYRYFKRAVELSSFNEVWDLFTNDQRVQYPDFVNPLRLYNVYPEFFLSLIYRTLPIGDAIDFYIKSVHIINGFFLGFVFLAGCGISKNVLGGLLSTLCFLYNYGHVTRAWWSVSLRESIGNPFFFAQIAILIYYFQYYSQKNGDVETIWKRLFSVSYFSCTFAFALSWQFAPFTLLTQITCYFVSYLLGKLSKGQFVNLALTSGSAVLLVAALQFGNQMLLNSLFFNIILSSVSIVILFPRNLIVNQSIDDRPPNAERVSFVRHIISLILVVVLVVLMASIAVTLKLGTAKFFGISDDGHIFDIIKAKFTSFSDFHTTLYLRQAEYQMIDAETALDVTKTLLLPTDVLIVLVLLIKIVFVPGSIFKMPTTLIYTLIQYLATSVMALLIMRLKVFWTPFGCVFAAALCHEEVYSVITFFTNNNTQKSNQKIVLATLLVLLIALMSVKGARDLNTLLLDEKEWDHVPLQTFLTWVNENTSKNAVFSGDMVDMSHIMMCTDRIVTNHPHYESVEIRDRTTAVYSLYSCKSPSDVHQILSSLGTDYILLTPHGCGKSTVFAAECSWDKNFCSQVHHAPSLFQRVYHNHDYTVFKLLNKK